MTNEYQDQETAEFEQLISARLPGAPASLRGNVQSLVRENLKRQTFRDDMKWLAFSLSILLLAFAAQWVVFSKVNQSTDEISAFIASAETAEQLPTTLVPFSAFNE